jgi:hypothetical protein
MTEMGMSGSMSAERRRSNGDGYTGTKLETADTAKPDPARNRAALQLYTPSLAIF